MGEKAANEAKVSARCGCTSSSASTTTTPTTKMTEAKTQNPKRRQNVEGRSKLGRSSLEKREKGEGVGEELLHYGPK